jgi:RNA-directed DNA polymerase
MRTDEAQARVSGTRVEGEGRQSSRAAMGAEVRAAAVERTNAEGSRLMEAVVERGNMRAAYRRVVENNGAPGVDGVAVAELDDWLKEHWPTVRAALLVGRYLPQAVRYRRCYPICC